jgi:hypothetical protein
LHKSQCRNTREQKKKQHETQQVTKKASHQVHKKNLNECEVDEILNNKLKRKMISDQQN